MPLIGQTKKLLLLVVEPLAPQIAHPTGIDVSQSYNLNARDFDTVDPNQPHITFSPE